MPFVNHQNAKSYSKDFCKNLCNFTINSIVPGKERLHNPLQADQIHLLNGQQQRWALLIPGRHVSNPMVTDWP